METIKAISHIGLAVASIEDAKAFYVEKLGLEVELETEVPSRQIKICFLKAGNQSLELVMPTSQSSPIAAILNNHEQVAYHIAFKASDFHQTIDSLKNRGVEFQTAEPRISSSGSKLIFSVPQAKAGNIIFEIDE